MEDRGTYSPKEKYRRMFDDAIGQRMGSMALWRVLDEIGFFTSPASTKYHLSVPGGLYGQAKWSLTLLPLPKHTCRRCNTSAA